MLAQLESVNGRLASLEKREEERAYDTKPIWNRVLAEISEVNTNVSNLDTKVSELDKHMRSFDRKLDIMNKELLQVKADQRDLEMR